MGSCNLRLQSEFWVKAYLARTEARDYNKKERKDL